MTTKQAYNLLLASAIVGDYYSYRCSKFGIISKGKGRNKHPHKHNYRQKRGGR